MPKSGGDPVSAIDNPWAVLAYNAMLTELAKPSVRYVYWANCRLHAYGGSCVPEPPNLAWFHAVRQLISYTPQEAAHSGRLYCKVCCRTEASR